MNSTPAQNARGAANRVANYTAKDSPLDARPSAGRPLKPWKPMREKKIRCFLNEQGEPMIVLGDGSPMTATIGEWSLWILFQEAMCRKVSQAARAVE